MDQLEAYLNGPATVPPAGVVTNLNQPNRNGGPIALAVVCLFLATTACLGRAYSRIFVLKRLLIEDYLGLCAYFSYITVVYCYFRYCSNVGFFIHQWDLRGATLVEISYIGFIIDITYSLVLLFSKTAILIQWVRIFVPDRTRNWFFWTARIMMVANFCLYLSAVLSTIGACQPIVRMWEFWVPGTCIDRKARDSVNAVFNTVADVFILLLPQPIIWTLHMTTERKLGVSVVFSVGLLAVANSAGRLYSTVTLDYPDDVTKTFDTSYQFSKTLLWVMGELTCVLLVFCVPSLPKMVGDFSRQLGSRIAASLRSWTRLPRSRGSTSTNNNNGNDNSRTWKGTWLRPAGSASSTPRAHAYSGGDEEMGIVAETSTTELGPMRTRYVEQLKGGEKEGAGGPDGTGIIKTVEFNRRDDTASKVSSDSGIETQNHWIER